ncbi:MAG TPA: acyl-CoA dehydrogenase N-terminal domain-containing protein, partial [Paracoccus sp. (in: a-proteobacteria)]|nr:acyl-CoA dehydrogenase N-terminal domain-containing protein [Paracoccus sp. (in: a-proteobacteria)]
MTTYAAPIRDMQFVLHDVLEISKQNLPGYDELEPEFTQA